MTKEEKSSPRRSQGTKRPQQTSSTVKIKKFPVAKDMVIIVFIIVLVISTLVSLYSALVNKNMPSHLIFGSGLMIIASLVLYPVLFWQYQRVSFDELYKEFISLFRSGREEFMKRITAQKKASKGYDLYKDVTESVLLEMLSSHPDFVYVYKDFIYEYEKDPKKYTRMKDQMTFTSEKLMERTWEKLEDIGVDVRSYMFAISMAIGAVAFGVFLLTIRFVLSIESIRIPIANGAISLPLYSFEWAFIGAYIYMLADIIRRFVRRDLIPRVFMLSALRMIISPFAAIALVLLIGSIGGATGVTQSEVGDTGLLLISFVTGSAPMTTLRYVGDRILKRVGVLQKTGEYTGDQPTSMIEGVDTDTARRLEEEDICNIQTLAICNPGYLADRTKFNQYTIDDWRSQAILYILTGKRKALNKESGRESVYDEFRSVGIRTADDLLNSLEVKIVEMNFIKGSSQPNNKTHTNALPPRGAVFLDDAKAKELLGILGWEEEKQVNYLRNLCLAVSELLKKGATPAGKT